jgi:hypothetical protein
VQYGDAVTLLPAALGVLVLQKAYAVTRAAVTPRLLPPQITLVSANSRFNLASLLTTSLGAAVALGLDHVLGGHASGAAWVLRVATVIYLAGTGLGLRLPDRVDEQTSAPAAAAANGSPASPNGGPANPNGRPVGPNGTAGFPAGYRPGEDASGAAAAVGAGGGGAAGTSAAGRVRRRPFTIPRVGPVVAEAMRANAAVRVFYGFMISFLAFILRTEKFGHISDKVALGGLALAIAAGGLIGTGIGSAVRARAPQLLIFTVLVLSMLVTALGAVLFGLAAVLIVALAAAIAQTLVKASLDSILQRDIPAETRSSTFAFSETLHQLALVGGGLLGLALSLTNSGQTGLTVAACGLVLALGWLLLARRRRILGSHPVRTPG